MQEKFPYEKFSSTPRGKSSVTSPQSRSQSWEDAMQTSKTPCGICCLFIMYSLWNSAYRQLTLMASLVLHFFMPREASFRWVCMLFFGWYTLCQFNSQAQMQRNFPQLLLKRLKSSKINNTLYTSKHHLTTTQDITTHHPNLLTISTHMHMWEVNWFLFLELIFLS